MNQSVCFPRIPMGVTETHVAQMFEQVHHIDLVTMEDSEGEFQMAFVHFIDPERMRGFVEHVSQNEFYMNDWLVKPNYKPVKRSTRKWTETELEEIEEYYGGQSPIENGQSAIENGQSAIENGQSPSPKVTYASILGL